MSSISTDEYLSRAEVERTLRELSADDMRKLRAMAGLYTAVLKRTVYTCDDLLQEAIQRTLASVRGWKRGIQLLTHMRQAMRSVADAWYRQARLRKLELPFGAGWRVEEGPDLEAGSSLTNSKAHELPDDPRAVHFWAEVRARLKDKKAEVELQLLEGLADGSAGFELRDALGLSRQTYESAMKRIRRTAAKLRQEGT